MKDEQFRTEKRVPWSLIIGPGTSELIVLVDGDGIATQLQCPECNAIIGVPKQGFQQATLVHEGSCKWVERIAQRMNAGGAC
jgi:hypothetical protein